MKNIALFGSSGQVGREVELQLSAMNGYSIVRINRNKENDLIQTDESLDCSKATQNEIVALLNKNKAQRYIIP